MNNTNTRFLHLFLAIQFFTALGVPLFAQSIIDESSVTTTYFASPQGVDTNDGLSAESPKSLPGAITIAQTTPSRVVLLDGDYRTSIAISPGSTPLILEAQNKGKTLITGSDRVASWTKLGEGVYSFPWTHEWGVANSGFPGDWTPYNLRREMLFIDGSRLLQRVDGAGNSIPAEHLLPGEFTVDETANLIYFTAPKGVTISESTVVEAAIRSSAPPASGQSLVKVEQRSNLVLRGLVIQHAVSAVKNGNAMSVSGTGKESNLLIEDCIFRENNGIGLEISGMTDVTLLRVNAFSNGSRGAGFYWVRNALVQDCHFNENNWRTAPANIGHDAAGFKIFDGNTTDSYFLRMGDNLRFLRCNFNRNLGVGFWQDFGGTNTTLDSCRFDNNEQGGVMVEMTVGPLLITNCVVSNNGGFGVMTYGAPNGHIEKSTIFGSRTSEIAKREDPQYCAEIMLVTDNRTNGNLGKGNEAYGRLDHWTITESTIQATFPAVPIFYASQYGGENPKNPPKIDFISTLASNRNRWFRAEGHGQFKAEQAFFSDTKHELGWRNEFTDITFEEWQAQTNTLGQQDTNSKWGEVDLSDILDPTIDPGAPTRSVGAPSP